MKELSIKQKKGVVLTLMTLLILVIYNNNIKIAINLYKEYQAMIELIETHPKLPQYVESLEQELSFQSTGNKTNAELDDVTQSKLFDHISSACNKFQLKLVKFGDPIVYKQEKYTIELNIITMEGGFINLTRCVHWLESINSVGGTIMSTEYRLYKKTGISQDGLLVTIYLQRIVANDLK